MDLLPRAPIAGQAAAHIGLRCRVYASLFIKCLRPPCRHAVDRFPLHPRDSRPYPRRRGWCCTCCGWGLPFGVAELIIPHWKPEDVTMAAHLVKWCIRGQGQDVAGGCPASGGGTISCPIGWNIVFKAAFLLRAACTAPWLAGRAAD